MKIMTTLIVLLCVGICFVGYTNYKNMHRELDLQLSTNIEIKELAGDNIHYEYLSSGNDCKYGGSCEESFWVFKVTGKKRCILVDVTLYEKFPNYSVVSVAPVKSQVKSQVKHYVNDNVTKKYIKVQSCT